MSERPRPHIVVAEPLHSDVMQHLRQFATVNELKDPTPEELIEAVREADALVIRARSHVTARVIDAATKLRVIGRAGPSLDHIDIKAAQRKKITVVYTPMAQVASTADFTVAMILACSRRIGWYDRKVREGQFETLRTPHGREFGRLTIGLLGGGPVAGEVARIFRAAFHSRVLNHAPEGIEPIAVEGVTPVGMDELLSECDVLSLHLPSTDIFNHLVGEEQLRKMKATACVVNTSRGTVIDNHALGDALKTHRLAGAAIDVFDAEPLPIGHPLRNAPNCTLTPHVAAQTLDAAESYLTVAEDVLRVLNGDAPQYPATPRGKA